MMRSVLTTLGPWGPVFFGVGFLAPLIATLMVNGGITPPLGLTAVQAGLILGFVAGLQAKLRGRWL